MKWDTESLEFCIQLCIEHQEKKDGRLGYRIKTLKTSYCGVGGIYECPYQIQDKKKAY